jgi:hypothetical protein
MSNLKNTTLAKRDLPDNYIYISHLVGEIGADGTVITEPYFILPTDPDSIADSLGSTFQENSALSRSAPVYTYSHSGPRDVQFAFKLHRDMMDEFNKSVSNYHLGEGEDYVDALIKVLQSIAVPKYNLQNKLVEPPLVAVRIGNQLFVKGIVNGGVTVNYEKPLLYPDKKYAVANVQFKVSEIDPYDASTIFKNGSFRGVTKTMKKGFRLEE